MRVGHHRRPKKVGRPLPIYLEIKLTQYDELLSYPIVSSISPIEALIHYGLHGFYEQNENCPTLITMKETERDGNAIPIPFQLT